MGGCEIKVLGGKTIVWVGETIVLGGETSILHYGM